MPSELATATNIQDEDVEEIPSRYLHTQNRNRNRNRNRARKNNAAARARARARARRRRRRRRNRNRRNRNRLFTNTNYIKDSNRVFTNRNYVRESTQQQQSSTEQVDVTENLGGCSGAEGSICAIFYPQAPPNEIDNAGTADDIDYDDFGDDITRSGGGTVDTTDEEDPTEQPQPTFVSPTCGEHSLL